MPNVKNIDRPARRGRKKEEAGGQQPEKKKRRYRPEKKERTSGKKKGEQIRLRSCTESERTPRAFGCKKRPRPCLEKKSSCRLRKKKIS